MDPILVEPKGAAPAAAVTPEDIGAEAPAAPGAAPAQSLPDDLVRLPAIQALIAGDPAPAFSASIKTFSKREEAKKIAANAQILQQAGIGFYKALDGETGVVFNGLYLNPEEIKAADAAGKLKEIAPPFDEVTKMVKGGKDAPALRHKGVPQGFKEAPMPEPPAAGPSVPPPTAGAQKKVASARMAALKPQPPTAGSAPGQGELLRSILKPVV